MLDWPNEGTGGCACIFERKEYCGVAEPIEWCAYHSKLRNENARLRAAVLELKDTEISDIACTGSDAPVEDALGKLFDLVPNDLA